MQLQII
jgi:hypothetical protein